MPSLFRSSSRMPLPADITDVIRIAAADEEACRRATSVTGERSSVLVEAARLYLKQVLFSREADCFRVLGISPEASKSTAREHMRLLMIWLHPDRNRDGDSVFANRVVSAWNEVSRNQSAPVANIRGRTAVGIDRKTRRRLRVSLIPVERAGRKKKRARFWTVLAVATAGICVGALAFMFPEQVRAVASALSFDQ